MTVRKISVPMKILMNFKSVKKSLVEIDFLTDPSKILRENFDRLTFRQNCQWWKFWQTKNPSKHFLTDILTDWQSVISLFDRNFDGKNSLSELRRFYAWLLKAILAVITNGSHQNFDELLSKFPSLWNFFQ